MCRTHGDTEMTGGAKPDPTQGRELLPANVVPKHYDLILEPDLEKFTFDGKVVIDLDVEENSSSVELHTLELDIQSAKVSSGGVVIR